MALAKARTRRLKFWWHLAFAYIARYRYWYISAILSLIILVFAVYKVFPVIYKSNTIAVGYIGSYSLETLPTEALNLVTEPLISIDKSGKPTPDLASHWTVTDDGKTYVLFLKDGLRWHDETHVNAKDITVAIENVTLTALNNKAIEFKLPSAISSFPTALNKPVFKKETFYGTGNYRIVDIDTVNGVVKKLALVPKSNDLPKVDVKFYNTEVQAQNAMKIGEIKNLKTANGQEFENWPNLTIVKEVDDTEIVTIFFNTEDPTLSSKEIRQGLIHALNRDELDGQKSLGPISPSSWAHNANLKRYEFNTAKALELFSKSGAKTIELELTTAPGLENLAQKIKGDWEEVGVKTTIIKENASPKNFQALLAVNKLNPDPDQYSLWHSSQAGKTNITNYKDVKIDKLLEDGRTTQDEAKRKEAYADFQRFLVEDAPAAFLYSPYKYNVTYKNAEDLITKLSLK